MANESGIVAILYATMNRTWPPFMVAMFYISLSFQHPRFLFPRPRTHSRPGRR